MRALDPVERHKLGAHYTPRAYVERLVLPAIIAPLRAEWDAVKAAALVYVPRSRNNVSGHLNRHGVFLSDLLTPIKPFAYSFS